MRLPGIVKKLLAPQSQQPFSVLVRLPYNFEEIFFKLYTEKGACNYELNAKLKNEKLKALEFFTNKLPPFQCPAGCYTCCNDIILMTYLEYRLILDYLKVNWAIPDIIEVFKKHVGKLSINNSPLCPFVSHSSHPGHCRIYPARPLVCRAYGTSVHPCTHVELGKYPPFDEKAYYQIHFELMHNGKDVIGIELDNNKIVTLTTFEIWAVLDTVEPEARNKIFNTYISSKRFNFSAQIVDKTGQLILYENGRITHPSWFNFC